MAEAFDIVALEAPEVGIAIADVGLVPASLQDVRLDYKSAEIKALLG